MKATGIVRRVDDLDRIVIPRGIRRTLRIREIASSCAAYAAFDLLCEGIYRFAERATAQ